ncbi:hypothetical protein BDB00DRAFT_215513 [Zychaea mexicana]|uniref:uncharacterized protein n=1 Tax=Zychaea mexicana TaxID=64656 RepID=UPI0022FE103A|nr:uncharacterized protein BDB00DRAFT_215513 [Zychaea mexicana]KAI9472956.1 hypothetical protein BDB00DRAFT_215513 [Zychaea mexicana]
MAPLLLCYLQYVFVLTLVFFLAVVYLDLLHLAIISPSKILDVLDILLIVQTNFFPWVSCTLPDVFCGSTWRLCFQGPFAGRTCFWFSRACQRCCAWMLLCRFNGRPVLLIAFLCMLKLYAFIRRFGFIKIKAETVLVAVALHG